MLRTTHCKQSHSLVTPVLPTGVLTHPVHPCAHMHSPQQFVRDLVLRGRCFSGRVLDAGCGIGDNALFIQKACPQAHVTAVDVVGQGLASWVGKC